MSKMGLKHAGLICDPARYLSNFAEDEYLSKHDLTLVKHTTYFLKVWAGIKSNTAITTFCDLRKQSYTNSSAIMDIGAISSFIHSHIHCAYFFVRMSITF